MKINTTTSSTCTISWNPWNFFANFSQKMVGSVCSDPGDAHLGANFLSAGKNCTGSMCIANVKSVGSSDPETMMGSQNLEIGLRAPGHAHLRASLWSAGKNCSGSMCIPNLKCVASSDREILRGSQNFDIGPHAPGHAPLGANLLSTGKNCPGSM